MDKSAFNFLFFGSSRDWEHAMETFKDESVPDSAVVRQLIIFAAEFGLSGNIWQHWLTYQLMTDENAFTLACERQPIVSDSTLVHLAETDFDLFRELFHMDFAAAGKKSLAKITAYSIPYQGYEISETGKRIASLSEKLASAQDSRTFIQMITRYYTTYGTGKYGLYKAFRVLNDGTTGVELIPVTDNTDAKFDDLVGLESQKRTLKDNTEAFLKGEHANNVLLYGDSGTGKSTSIHALMHDYYDQGLRLVEVSKQDRKFLPSVMAAIKKRNYRFIIFLDDLSFEEDESDYKELKAMLEGALENLGDRVLTYATSNRRHLIRETWTDRNDMEFENDIHRSDTIEEKLSLASRFGVTINYAKPNQEEYQRIVRKLAEKNGLEISDKDLMDEARKWELRHGGMSGRTASQFITWLKSQSAIKS